MNEAKEPETAENKGSASSDCSSRQCGVLFPSRSPVEPTDFDGCVLPTGHVGEHEFIGADLLRYGWETDMECECEECRSDNVDEWCNVYRLIR